jgi:hypothetical protein
MTSFGSIRWVLLALAGLVVAAAVSVAASQLVSQRIGLAAAPVSAGKELAPQHDSGNAGQGGGDAQAHRRTTTTTTTTTATAPPTTATAPSTTATAPTTTTPPVAPSGGSQGEPPDD